MAIFTRIYPHYPKPNPTPPLKRRDLNAAFHFATTGNLTEEEGPPAKRMAIIETEPILTESIYPIQGARLIKPSPHMHCNEDARYLVQRIKMAVWENSIIDVSQDHFDSLKIDKNTHTILKMIICDHGAKQGLMAKNVTDNFAREVKPQQLRHFFNQHVCHHDNIDLFYAHYIKNVYMQDPQDFYFYNLGVYSNEEIKEKTTGSRNGPEPNTAPSQRDLSLLQLPNSSSEQPIDAPFKPSMIG
jgi:hypothetical protein